jgi:hypothetical protein
VKKERIKEETGSKESGGIEEAEDEGGRKSNRCLALKFDRRFY